MAVLSVLRSARIELRCLSRLPILSSNRIATNKHFFVQLRYMADKSSMIVAPSKFFDKKFKDTLHLYFFVGAAPLLFLVFLVNVFIGPARLAEIPEEYEPRHWEYFPHPIQRWFARYVYTNPQQEYEKYMHYLQQEHEIVQIRQLETKVKKLMAERGDYQAWYYVPVSAKYHRRERDLYKQQIESSSD